MLLWVAVLFIVLSASGILYLALGPLRTAGNAAVLRGFAAVQYLCAAVLVGARLLGKA